jgi:Cof subfamily protein (haloacid dehalogenase superfamily)
MTDIKLIVVDLDSTLLNDENTVSERNEKAIKAAITKGVKVMIATGKTRASAKALLDKLQLNTPGIFNQGLIIYGSDGAIKHQHTLDKTLIRRIVTFVEDRGFHVVAYAGDRLLEKSSYPGSAKLATQYGEPTPESVGPLQNLLETTKINKLLIVREGEPQRILGLRWQLEKQTNGSAHITQAMLKDMIEILPPRASKGAALRVVLKEMGMNAANVMAIGDGENDIEMIELAQIGVAVENASDKLKAVADHTVASNVNDGVAEAIDRFVLGGTLDKDEKADTPPPAKASSDDKTEEKPE